jgi:hypothetical protein
MQIGEKGIENLFILNMVLEKKKKKKKTQIWKDTFPCMPLYLGAG